MKIDDALLKMSIWNDNCSLGDGYTIENCNYDDELLNFTVDFSNEQICKNGFFFFAESNTKIK